MKNIDPNDYSFIIAATGDSYMGVDTHDEATENAIILESLKTDTGFVRTSDGVTVYAEKI